MKCPKCSLQNPETQRFCGGCGTRLDPDEGEEVSRTTTIKLPFMTLPIGSTFAERYQIIEELGKGGMGRVYRALDKKVDEEIAVKFIRPELAQDPQAVDRFRTELKAARQVIHKNVARMFDLNEEEGIPYITMEYVRGENLKSLIRKVGRLDAQQAIPIAKQVAAGLAEAHRTGVVHRDLKPHNIMIDEEGTARITDFGLARLRKGDDGTLTNPGMGTPSYLSPEQVEGSGTDGRSDLYSLGIVLYEMLTGRVPFEGDSPYSTAMERLIKEPPDPRSANPEIPEALVQVIMKCLQKDRENRYQIAEELISDLDSLGIEFLTTRIPAPRPEPAWIRPWRWAFKRRIPHALLLIAVLASGGYFISERLSAPPRMPWWKVSLAVLPILDMDPQMGQKIPLYGLQSDISARLTSIPELRVVPAPSLAGYDYAGKGYLEIGKELGADYLLKLTLKGEGARLLLRLDLIEAKTGSVVNYYDYQADLEDIYAVQDEISRYTAGALRASLAEERLRSFKKREPTNLEAYNCYWEGMRLIEKEYHAHFRPEDFAQAVRMYERAIEIEPKYALAHWGLGNAYEARYNNVSKDPEDMRKMRESYLRAYEAAPDFAETNLGVGWMHFNYKDNVRASHQFKQAFELDPNNFIVNQDVGAFLRSVGLYDKAVKYLSRAAEIDPNSFNTRVLIATSLIYLGKFKEAVLEAEKAIQLAPERYNARYHCATGLIMMNRLEEAQKEIDIVRKIHPEREMNLLQALLLAARGEKERALERLRLTSSQEAMNWLTACIDILLDRKEEAVRIIREGIERGFEERGEYLFSYLLLANNPIFKRLNSEPLYREILRGEKAKYREKLRTFAKL
ncbi:MAG: protein kinase [Candidatus Aminicenantes bacterium]|nr:protein kinase [Candidatus Aminicenantes bacterium]